MMTFIPPRLRVPLIYGAATVLFAAAWLIRGGNTWWIAILALVTMGTRTVLAYYYAGRQDTDAGALVGGRPDERLKVISNRSWAVVGKVAMAAAFLGVTIGVAIRALQWWQFVIMLGITIFAYLFGLSNNGFAADDADEDTAAGSARSPVRQ
jgi:hypothetical protein